MVALLADALGFSGGNTTGCQTKGEMCINLQNRNVPQNNVGAECPISGKNILNALINQLKRTETKPGQTR